MEFEREKNISQELLKLVWQLIAWTFGVSIGSAIIVLGTRFGVNGIVTDTIASLILMVAFIVLGTIISIICSVWLFITWGLVFYNIIKYGIRDGRIAEKRVINEEGSYRKYVKELEKQNAEQVVDETTKKTTKKTTEKTEKNDSETDENDCDYEEIV